MPPSTASSERAFPLERRVVEHRAQLKGIPGERGSSAAEGLEAYVCSVVHDLRAPLRAIDGFSKLLLEDHAGGLDPQGRRMLGAVRDGTVTMRRSIDDILALSRAGHVAIRKRPVDMGGLVAGVLAVELATAGTGRELAIDIGALPTARGASDLLRLVWLNLLDNAIKFTAPNPHARIAIGAASGSGETVYFVRDTGVGFDPGHAGRLFGMFEQLHGREFGGTGIGLAIVKRIVARHGGRVWAESKIGEGATFYFALPTDRADK